MKNEGCRTMHHFYYLYFATSFQECSYLRTLISICESWKLNTGVYNPDESCCNSVQLRHQYFMCFIWQISTIKNVTRTTKTTASIQGYWILSHVSGEALEFLTLIPVFCIFFYFSYFSVYVQCIILLSPNYFMSLFILL